MQQQLSANIGIWRNFPSALLAKGWRSSYIRNGVWMESPKMPVWGGSWLRRGVAFAALTALALPPALAAMSRSDRIRDTQLSNELLGQFTPAAGDPRLIARYAKVSQSARQDFSFTPVLASNEAGNRAITVVVRARDAGLTGGDAARTRALISGPAQQPVAITPVAYNLGASVGFDKFVMPQVGRGVDIRNLPDARAIDQRPAKPARFASRVSSIAVDPAGAPPRAAAPSPGQEVDLSGSYRVARNLNVTAGVRYSSDERLRPLTNDQRDNQAVYVGTQFRF
jgi:hypothetical protein